MAAEPCGSADGSDGSQVSGGFSDESDECDTSTTSTSTSNDRRSNGHDGGSDRHLSCDDSSDTRRAAAQGERAIQWSEVKAMLPNTVKRYEWQDITICEEIGRGALGRVFRIEHHHDTYAMKIISCERADFEDVVHELRSQLLAAHPSCLRVYGMICVRFALQLV